MTYFQRCSKAFVLFCILLSTTGVALAEDIDLFIGSKDVSSGAGLPNVIFVLDNTSNWARQAQQWPGGLQQGQSEARALKVVMADVMAKIQAETLKGLNVGLIELTTSGNANQDGGFVRHHLQELNATSKAKLDIELDKIFNNVNSSTEKRNSNTAYGNLMYDVYNYLAGTQQSYSGGGTDSTIADPDGYTNKYSKFRSPLDSKSLCAKTYLIFIGNPDQSGPTGDSAENSAALKSLYLAAGAEVADLNGFAGSSSPLPLPLPKFTTATVDLDPFSLGLSNSCYVDVASCTTGEGKNNQGGVCDGLSGCACESTNPVQGSCPKVTVGNGKDQVQKQTYKYQVVQTGQTGTEVKPVTGSYDTSSGRAWNMDDWSKFLFSYGVPVTQTNAQGQSYTERATVITYAIDVFNKQQSSTQTSLMLSASKTVGGGQYYAAKNEDAIVDAITDALSDIISESSVFAAATLPLSASNQVLSENQVYLGMFRPDQKARPRWYGNMKRYQIAIYNGVPALADADFKPALNPSTGFAGECSRSFWSSNTNAYWDGLGIIPSPLSKCLSSTTSPWSDAPDGPFVEKGAAAYRSRNGLLSDRNVRKMSGLTSVSATDVGSTDVLNYFVGTKVGADNEIKNASDDGRPSLHGDVVHSRPLTINYGLGKPTYIFYGSNDGLYRAIQASSGDESWALIAPQHYSKIDRLYKNSPIIAFPNQDPLETPKPAPKDYFMDGSTGQYIEYDKDLNVTKAWIYPTMRRGGSMVYALDVSNPAVPLYKWIFDAIGQTWSLPISAKVAGYATNPILMFGGGYDAACLDLDQKTNTCSGSSKGSMIYVLDANTGTELRGFATDAPVVADMAPVDINKDGKVDFAYTVDAKGGVWRVNFATMAVNGTLTPLEKADWTHTKVAESTDSSLRFLNTPAVLALNDRVYVALGSGNRERPLETNYPYTESVKDRFYAFVDFPAASLSAVDLNGDKVLDVTNLKTGSGASCDAKGQRGWRLGMDGKGEQIVNPGLMIGGNVFFNSYQPGGDANAGGTCRPLGTGKAYKVNLLSPACNVEQRLILSDGMPIAPTIATVLAPVCTTDGKCSGEEEQITVCIGCGDGLDPTLVEASPPASRQRTYWGGDVDR